MSEEEFDLSDLLNPHQYAKKVAKREVVKVQEFNLNSFARKDELGNLHFGDVEEDAVCLVALFRRLPLAILDELPSARLDVIFNLAREGLKALNASSTFQVGGRRPKSINYVRKVRVLSPITIPPSKEGKEPRILKSGMMLGVDHAAKDVFKGYDDLWKAIVDGKVDPMMDESAHDDVVAQIRGVYDRAFSVIPTVATYGIVAGTNLKALSEEMAHKVEEANGLLVRIRDTAAQQGVFLQAAHFKAEADSHHQVSRHWGKGVALALLALGAYPFLINWLFPVNLVALSELSGTAERFVFLTGILSRMLIFFVFSFGLFFCVRNYMAHRHNTVVNRHRQKALETYRALVDGTNIPENADIVLSHAARCIYAPQNTGFMHTDKSESQMGTTEIIRHSSEGLRAARAVKGE